jgi:hypothetical protein
VAIGIALLKYRLWDLDVVLKKTLVAAVLVTSIVVVAFVVLLAIGGIVVGPLSDNPGAMLVAGVVQGILFWPLLRLSRRIADRLVYGRRTTPYEVLTEFSGRLAETYSSDDVLPRMASILGQGTGADEVTIWLLSHRRGASAPHHGPRRRTVVSARSPNARSCVSSHSHQHQSIAVLGEGPGLGTRGQPYHELPAAPALHEDRLVTDLQARCGINTEPPEERPADQGPGRAPKRLVALQATLGDQTGGVGLGRRATQRNLGLRDARFLMTAAPVGR